MPGWGVAERVKVCDWVRVVAEREKTGQGAAKPVGRGEGLVQAAFTARMEKKAEVMRAAPAAAVPIRKDFLRCDIGENLVTKVGDITFGFLQAWHQRRNARGTRWSQGCGCGVHHGHVDGR